MSEQVCPYCGNTLIKGTIICGRYECRWRDESHHGFIDKYTVFGGEKLHDNTVVKCLRCKNCNKVIIDFNDQ